MRTRGASWRGVVLVAFCAAGCPSAGISDVACTTDSECPPGSSCPSDGIVVARCVAGIEPGQASDAGESPDAEVALDAGEPPDSGSSLDAGEREDAGHRSDAGGPADAGDLPDAGNVGPLPDGGCVSTSMCPANGRDACISGACLPDPTWTQNTVPADSPPDSEYTDNGNGTVTDNATGLIWQQPMSTATHTWADAAAYCQGLSLGGYSTGWRLPSVVEALSLVLVGGNPPTINKTEFPNTLQQEIWTATPDASGAGANLMWTVDFAFGINDSEDATQSTEYVRCVLSFAGGTVSPVGEQSPMDTSAPPGRYTYPDGTEAASLTVYDTVTQLTWERNPPATTHSYSDAAARCAALSLATLGSGWRMPTTKELGSIVDFGVWDPAIDTTAFPNTQDNMDYWCTVPQATAGGEISFSDGTEDSFVPATALGPDYVRCVH